MATQYDYVILSIGYNKFIMPRKAAYTLFDACQGQDIYRYDTEYNSSTRVSEPLIKEVEDDTIKIEHIGPGTFHLGRTRWQMKEEEKRKKENES